ncbi:hypothetical protein [Geotalea toluenoxydans]|uniref:hypothetical protein n=1 Tax=Geotalea toluenoxydans TaxID=421624 RepID=UPI0006D00491|nr:hypothetical protein [Geotalea toluenoxydans]
MKKEIVFFIDQEQFKTEKTEVTVRELLEDFAMSNPNETTLVRRHGNELEKLMDLAMVLTLVNGMKFVVYHNTPTTVS